MTTTTIARGSEWSDENLKSSWGEIDSAYDYKAVERKLSDMVTKRFAELAPDSVSWIPYTSEVIGDVTEDYSDIDLDALRQQAQDEIYQQWTNGDIDIEDCLNDADADKKDEVSAKIETIKKNNEIIEKYNSLSQDAIEKIETDNQFDQLYENTLPDGFDPDSLSEEDANLHRMWLIANWDDLTESNAPNE